MEKENCAGCEDDFYNGNNPYNVKECWRLKDAKIIMRKKVHVSQEPPFNQKCQKFPDCYTQKKYVFMNENGNRINKCNT